MTRFTIIKFWKYLWTCH